MTYFLSLPPRPELKFAIHTAVCFCTLIGSYVLQYAKPQRIARIFRYRQNLLTKTSVDRTTSGMDKCVRSGELCDFVERVNVGLLAAEEKLWRTNNGTV